MLIHALLKGILHFDVPFKVAVAVAVVAQRLHLNPARYNGLRNGTYIVGRERERERGLRVTVTSIAPPRFQPSNSRISPASPLRGSVRLE
ncbi:hypothetical protein CGRA01v4_03766 [Colletotrichum graminicola]|nr:hypothetical protein CGRA01v4_03766 [Colletotrichum graminicola]